MGWTRDKGDIRNYYQAQDYETWSKDPGGGSDDMWRKTLQHGSASGWEKTESYKQAWFEYGQAGKLLRYNKKGMKKNRKAVGKNISKVIGRAKEINKAAADKTAADAAAKKAADAAAKKAAQEGAKKARGIGTGTRGIGTRPKGAVYRRTMLGSGGGER